MTRWYYTDPLAASWMAKHFGMKIDLGKGTHGLAAKVTVEDGLLGVMLGFSAESFRYYIHTDSLHLLEPIDGDVILRTNGYCQTVGWNIGIPKAKIQLDAGAEIIRRNGRPFHWPEQEAA